MAGIDLGLILAFVCGVVCAWAIQNPKKASRTIRGFLGGVSRGARSVNDKYEPGGGGETRRRRRPRRDDYDYDDDYEPEPHPIRKRRPAMRIETCQTCNGSGHVRRKGVDFSGSKIVCPDCDGHGQVQVAVDRDDGR